jgi:hypothetical protein
VSVRAKKAVVIATGGMTSHLQFRGMFAPRVTAALQVAGEPIPTRTPAADGRHGHRRVAPGLANRF